MIVVFHQYNKVTEIERDGKNINILSTNIPSTLFKIANDYPDDLIIWCNTNLKASLNFLKLESIFHHHKIMASYSLTKNAFLSQGIGYVEGTPFININKKVSYPTWQMSSSVGGIHASALLPFRNEIKISNNFDYFLNSLAKLAMPLGLLCYSEPALLKDIAGELDKDKQSLYVLFRFIKQHYKLSWVFLLFLNFFIYERKVTILPLVFSLFYRRRRVNNNLLDLVEVQSVKKILENGTIDVIIPTIGRKKYLYDVLKDLSVQSHLPKNVIIVEQNPSLDSTSELDYITNENWPFVIKHTFTHQAGACNARNLALNEVVSEWVFLNDDDNRFGPNLIEDTLRNCVKYGSRVSNNFYPKIGEKKQNNNVYQVPFFGSGNSFITSNLLEKARFRMGFEFGYGEDSDFGMQLRNLGADVLFFPDPEISHLSAPIGGFRTKPVLAWQNDVIQPKPSPTIMLYNQLHKTPEQIKGYKTTLFFKFYKVQKVKNPIKYLNNFRKQWKQSLFWANELKNK